MILGLCSSPLTQRAVARWNQALKDELVLLRDIIDLDATYNASSEQVDLSTIKVSQEEEAPVDEDVTAEDEDEDEGDDGEEESEENNLSLSMLEEVLKPQVLETFAKISSAHKKAERLRLKKLEAIKGGTALPTCLYCSVLDPRKIKLSWKDCILAASLTVKVLSCL